MHQPHLPAALPLAQVQTPTGVIWYIPRAQRHGNFIAQLRYRSVGKKYYTLDEEEKIIWENARQFVAYAAPFLNPGAVRAAGLDVCSIMSQMAQQPEEIFMHPTYGQLCLKWGENVGGYTVTERVSELLPDEMAIAFTPHTCWLTGTTYYQLDFTEQAEVFERLLLRAGLRAHEQEIGLEGNWSGWYVTDLTDVRFVLAESGHYPVVASAQIWYGLKVVEKPADTEQWVRVHRMPEEAFALYQQVPEFTADPSALTWTHLQYGRVIQWPGRALEWQAMDSKEVESEHAGQLVAGKITGMHALQALPHILTYDVVAEADLPLAPRVMTLRERLDTITISRSELARLLKWTPDKLMQRECNPEEITLAEVQQLAQMIAIPEETLLQELRKEIQARTEDKARWLASTKQIHA